MIDPKFIVNIVLDLFKQLTQMLYTHHAIARIHRSKMNQDSKMMTEREKEVHKKVSEFLMTDRGEFFDFI